MILVASSTIIITCVVAYNVGLWGSFTMKSKEINESVNVYSANQGNYLAIAQNNTFRQFPFIFGGRISIMALPEGKVTTITDRKGLLRGLALPSLQGDGLYFFDTWDDSVQGSLYWMDVKENNRPIVIAERVRKYTTDGDELFYTRTGITDSDYYLIQKNINAGYEKELLRFDSEMDGTLQYLSIKNGMLFCFDETKNILYAMELKLKDMEKYVLSDVEDDWVMDIQLISSNTALIAMSKSGIIEYNFESEKSKEIIPIGSMNEYYEFNRGRYSFYQKSEEIYFNDANYTIYLYGKDTNEKKEIINWDEERIKKEGIELSDSANINIYYCTDYIITEFRDWKTNNNRVIAFSYDGKVVLNKKVNLPDIGF